LPLKTETTSELQFCKADLISHVTSVIIVIPSVTGVGCVAISCYSVRDRTRIPYRQVTTTVISVLTTCEEH